jgi:hypothetical protein
LQRRTFLAATTALAATVIAAPSFAQVNDNPLLQAWTGPYGGVPAFDKVKVEYFKPALEGAMAENLREVEAIANQRSVPTFENTIEAMENTGRQLSDLFTYYGIWGSNMSTPAFQAVETEMDPRLAEFGDKITQNEALFQRIEAVYNSVDKARLTPEQQRLTWLYYTNFVRAGAKLDAPAKARVAGHTGIYYLVIIAVGVQSFLQKIRIRFALRQSETGGETVSERDDLRPDRGRLRRLQWFVGSQSDVRSVIARRTRYEHCR